MIVFDKFHNVEKLKLELVERKGLGHPDSLADGVVEQLSRSLASFYINRFGHVLHYNVDKLQLVAGESSPMFGGGKQLKPVFVLFSGRATRFFNNEALDVDALAFNTTRTYFKNILPDFDQDFLEMKSKIGQGSVDLRKLFSLKNKAPLANDTSFGAGFWPLSPTEQVSLDIEKYLQGLRSKKPFIGSDIKVMAVRNKKKIIFTIAIAFIDKYISSLEDYLQQKQELTNDLQDFAKNLLEGFDVRLTINNGDKPKKKEVYITVTGTSLEAGDDGAVGRGNRVNGLITPCRPMSLEAAAGKNSVSHVGKLYNIAATAISKRIYEAINKRCELKIVSQIGRYITKPLVVGIALEKPSKEEKAKAKTIALDFLSKDILELNNRLINNKINVF